MSSAPGDERSRFIDCLNAAITTGRSPNAETPPLGPLTTRALQMVAAEHPEATAYSIAGAYDAFAQEHR